MTGQRRQIVESVIECYERYYDDEIVELARDCQCGETCLEVDWMDIYRYDAALAEDYLDPQGMSWDELHSWFVEALHEYPLPTGLDVGDAGVRVVGLNDEDVYTPLELQREDASGYVGVSGQLSKISQPVELLETAAYRCQRCEVVTEVPQYGDEATEPSQCRSCERNGPFRLDKEQSEFADYCKLRVETPPDERGDLGQEAIVGDATGDLVWSGDDQYGLVARSGDEATVYGTVDYRQQTGRGASDREFDLFLRVQAIEWADDGDDIDIDAHRDEFEALAARDDAVDLFAESLAPELYATPAWETALELLVAWLFAAPRIDVPDSATIRGDVHALIMTDYGMGKSLVNRALARFSPNCIKESVTGMSSDVGLLAAAVEDDFGNGQWTLRPGILVRANGGHVILDEIDKTDADLARMNDALEGEQIVDINKAGQRAKYKSRVGLLATGNPIDSRFDPRDPVSDQLGIDRSLLSRFDGIVTMRDDPDEDLDGEIATTQAESYIEAQEFEHGDREELDRLERAVDIETGQAWVAHAREAVAPILKPEHIDQIRSWYQDARQMNEKYRSKEEEGRAMPAPVNPRHIDAAIRFAVAFARVHLRDEVADVDVERSIELSKALVGQSYDGHQFVPPEVQQRDSTHDGIRGKVVDTLDSEAWMYTDDIAREIREDEDDVRKALIKLKSECNPPRAEEDNGKWRKA